MKTNLPYVILASRRLRHQRGKAGWILLWLIGIPVPVLVGLYLIRGCT